MSRPRARQSVAWLDFLGLGVLIALLPYPPLFFGGVVLAWTLRGRLSRKPAARRRLVQAPAGA